MEWEIENVSKYLEWVMQHKVSEGDLPFEQSNVYYRGHANNTWKLTPSLFREPRISEYDAIKTATLRLWNQFSQYSYLERLVCFQHFGLKTRLLDVTFNPLIALFFACQDANTRDGESIDGVVLYGYCDDSH